MGRQPPCGISSLDATTPHSGQRCAGGLVVHCAQSTAVAAIEHGSSCPRLHRPEAIRRSQVAGGRAPAQPPRGVCGGSPALLCTAEVSSASQRTRRVHRVMILQHTLVVRTTRGSAPPGYPSRSYAATLGRCRLSVHADRGASRCYRHLRGSKPRPTSSSSHTSEPTHPFGCAWLARPPHPMYDEFPHSAFPSLPLPHVRLPQPPDIHRPSSRLALFSPSPSPIPHLVHPDR